MAWKTGLAAGMTLLGVGALPVLGDWQMYLQFGALGILAMAVVGLFRELAEQRKSAKSERDAHANMNERMLERWDGWELTRHSDHETLTQTLTDLQKNCAAVSQIRQIQRERNEG